MDHWINRSRTPTAAERLQYMANTLNVTLSDNDIHAACEFFGKMIFNIPPQEIEFVKDIIPEISKSFPLGIISDTGYISGHYIRTFLDQENLLKYFSSFMFSDENKYSKPHPSVFKTTADNLRISISALVHIGDLERTDVAGAKGAGCISIKFTGANHDKIENTAAHHVISDYMDLLKVVL